MTGLYPQSFLSLKEGIRYDLLAVGSLYGVARAGVQELLVSYKTEKRHSGQFRMVTESGLNTRACQGHCLRVWASDSSIGHSPTSIGLLTHSYRECTEHPGDP